VRGCCSHSSAMNWAVPRENGSEHEWVVHDSVLRATFSPALNPRANALLLPALAGSHLVNDRPLSRLEVGSKIQRADRASAGQYGLFASAK
jgi:hypothetical protein